MPERNGSSIYEIVREAQIHTIKEAFKQGFRSCDLKPELQYAPWFRQGLEILERNGEELTQKRLEEIIKAHTDSPDPFFT